MRRCVTYTVPVEWGGRTVKEFIRQYLGLSSRVLVKQKHTANGILKNGEPCRSVDRLSVGDVLELRLPEEAEHYQPTEGPLSVLWENEDYLIVDKPSQMPVHPSPGHDWDSLLNRVAYYYEQTGQAPAFRPLYRLDRDTSGLVVIGKHRVAASSAIVKKVYYGICQGELSGSGVIDVPIGLAPGSKIQRQCGAEGQPARTHWRSLGIEADHTLVEFRLETGRTHQIRVHMAHIGHPLAGDDLYGGSREGVGRQALHCGKISLVCKPLGTSLHLDCAFSTDLQESFPWITACCPELGRNLL